MADTISSLEAKILALQKGEEKTMQLVEEVGLTLGRLGFDYNERGTVVASYHIFSKGVNSDFRLWENGGFTITSDGESPLYEFSLSQVILACLVDILSKRAEVLKMRNRQIRDLRRSLRK